MKHFPKEYCKSNRNSCCLLELFDLANKRSFMRPRGLLRYEQEICNVISNSIRRFAPTANGDRNGRLTETGLEKLTELGNMIVNNENVDFQRYFHPIIGILHRLSIITRDLWCTLTCHSSFATANQLLPISNRVLTSNQHLSYGSKNLIFSYIQSCLR